MDQERPKFPQIWKIPDPPGMEERTTASIVHHDDIHNGEFGTDCGRCHSSESFEEVQQIR